MMIVGTYRLEIISAPTERVWCVLSMVWCNAYTQESPLLIIATQEVSIGTFESSSSDKRVHACDLDDVCPDRHLLCSSNQQLRDLAILGTK